MSPILHYYNLRWKIMIMMRLNTVLVLCYFNVGSRVENHFYTFWGAGDFSY